MKYLIILVIIIFIFKCWESHFIINFKSLFRKGFKLNDDNFGCYAFCR